MVPQRFCQEKRSSHEEDCERNSHEAVHGEVKHRWVNLLRFFMGFYWVFNGIYWELLVFQWNVNGMINGMIHGILIGF
jgi:hypothetical protein